MHNLRIKVIFVVIMLVSVFTLFPMIITAVAPALSNPYPTNGATDVELTPTLRTTVNDSKGDTMDITFRTNATGTWGDVGSNNSVYNGTYYQTNSSMNSYSTEYWWSVNCTDGSSWTNETYHFTTLDFLWIDVTNATWNLGMVAMESSTWTNETGETFICDMDNTTTNADLSLQITTDGATWKDASTPGDDRYRIYASADNWSSQHLISEDSSATISTVTTGQNETFDLRFDAPNSSTTKVQQTITITATIVEH